MIRIKKTKSLKITPPIFLCDYNLTEHLKQYPQFQLLDPKEALGGAFPVLNQIPVGASQENFWWQLWPNIHETDGFFAAILEKKTTDTPA